MPTNYPDNVSAADPGAPWNQTREPVHDESLIKIAMAELDEMESSLRFLDRHNPAVSHFELREAVHSPYLVIDAWRAKLREMLGEG
jgi:hypothetical protein